MSQIKRLFLEVTGSRLCCVDFGGDGSPVLLLHALAGRAAAWWNTATWLTATHRVLALDQRSHGRGDKAKRDHSRDAYVRDVIEVLALLINPNAPRKYTSAW